MAVTTTASGLCDVRWMMGQARKGASVAFCALVTACSASEPPTLGETEGSMMASSTGNAEGEGTWTGPGGSESSGPDDVSVELGPCARLVECATALGDAITPSLGVYGEQGTCWGEFEASACWQDCTAILANYRVLGPDVAQCGECADASDCAYDDQFDSCLDGVCSRGEPQPIPEDCSMVDFAAELQPIFEANCVDGCHSPGGVWQSLDVSGDAAAALILANGIETEDDPDLYLVAPGDLDNSHLIHKLRGTQGMRGSGAAFGAQMPLGRDPLSDAAIARIAEWVLCLE